MLIDALVSFGLTPISMIGGAGVALPSSVIDLLGQGVGTAPANIIGVPSATGVFGSDPGIDWPRVQAEILVSTAFTTGSGATANFAYQGAADDPTTHLPVAWTTIIESGEIAVTDMDAIGDIAWQFDFAPTHPLSFQPRYLRVLAQVSAGDTFTAGAILIPVTTGLDQQKNKYQAKNYTAYRAT